MKLLWRCRRSIAIALLSVAPGTVLALTDLGSLSPALPPAVVPNMGFAGDTAPGWSFAEAAFVDPGYRDPDPALPSLHGYDASFSAPLLAIGSLAEVMAVPPRPLGRDEMIADLKPAYGGLDAAALGVFDIANAQSFTNHSVTLGGGEYGRRLTFKFAGQVGSSNDD